MSGPLAEKAGCAHLPVSSDLCLGILSTKKPDDGILVRWKIGVTSRVKSLSSGTYGMSQQPFCKAPGLIRLLDLDELLLHSLCDFCISHHLWSMQLKDHLFKFGVRSRVVE